MAELLLELYSEEIPANMQMQAVADLKNRVIKFLKEADLEPTQCKTCVTPRRLALLIDGLDEKTPPRHIEKKGPRVDAPKKAIAGFLADNNLTDISELQTQSNPKGDYYLFVGEEPSRATKTLLVEGLPTIINNFPWPKSMRWGAGRLRWVRPLQAILCQFDGEAVTFSVDGLVAGHETYGHCFLAPEKLTIKRNADYLPTLEKAKVLADPSQRATRIKEQATKLAKDKRLELIGDDKLLAEIVGLVEWPVCLLGKIDEAFMTLPPEVLRAVMRTQQKYLTLQDPRTKQLAPYFIIVSNMETADKGAEIIAGNERVLRARLSDAKFFWEQDSKISLQDYLPNLENMIFHAKLGTVADKAERLEKLAPQIACLWQGRDVNDPPNATDRMVAEGARLCKADLSTHMVTEFPSLQGIIGGYYAEQDGLDKKTVATIRDHYKPLGLSDNIPSTQEGCIVALTDKIDTLVGFWFYGETPTGSKDPYALRRAALGIIRILLETKTHLHLRHAFEMALQQYNIKPTYNISFKKWNFEIPYFGPLVFTFRRLENYLHDQGIRRDIFDAIIWRIDVADINFSDDVIEIEKKAQALQQFLATKDGDNLLTAYHRAEGIHRESGSGHSAIDEDLFQEDAERVLYAAIKEVEENPYESKGKVVYGDYLKKLADFREPINRFFEEVLVNHEDEQIKNNRLALLNEFLELMSRVADFSNIQKDK